MLCFAGLISSVVSEPASGGNPQLKCINDDLPRNEAAFSLQFHEIDAGCLQCKINLLVSGVNILSFGKISVTIPFNHMIFENIIVYLREVAVTKITLASYI